MNPSLNPSLNPTLPPKLIALIPCAGAGLRAGGEQPKQYQNIAGKQMVLHTLAAFAAVTRITQTVVVVSPEDAVFESLASFGSTVGVLRCGGATRADTVKNGLQALLRMVREGKEGGYSPNDWVLVHDAARCLITPEQINHLIDECENDAVGGLLACPVADTLKSSFDGRIESTVDRASKWAAQTPQMFRMGQLAAALDKALQAGVAVTDEASAIEYAVKGIGLQPKLVAASSQNFKVTYPDDFALAEAILHSRKHPASMPLTPTSTFTPTFAPTFRIGEGWDTHQLVDLASTGRKLILGGVDIPFTKGLLGHSDADALCHAITDALLGAAALGDIGKHFPDTDPRYKGADSIVLLRHTADLVRAQGWHIGNIDSTVIAQAPKLAPHIEAMRLNLSQALGLAVSQVSVKAKTAEKMGPVGEGLAMEARAVVILMR
jgi:2-C-methyl-D-erythritol 4-phosphate cytidylyltransferase / 2-C-methyl-D-erythritol 2,4-cyclodiphosphate synthase